MNFAYLFAFFAAFLWGAGFIGSRFGLEAMGPFWVCFFRFFIAFLVCSPFLLIAKTNKWNKEKVKGILLCSIFLGGVMFFQVAGLQYTTVAKSGFITVLYVFFTPLIAKVFMGQRLGLYFYFLASLAFLGICLLFDFRFSNFNYGDALTLGCALSSALQIIFVGKYANEFESVVTFNVYQMLGVSLFALPLALIFEGTVQISSFINTAHLNMAALWSLIFMGIFCTGLAFFMQISSQKKIRPHVASLIYLLESPLGVLMAWMMLGEGLNNKELIGCAITIVAVGLIPLEKAFQPAKNNVTKRP